MTIVNIDNVVYGVDADGFRWAVPVDEVVLVREIQGWNPELNIPQAFPSLWTRSYGAYIGATADDTLEAAFQAVYGVPWPEGAPQPPAPEEPEE